MHHLLAAESWTDSLLERGVIGVFVVLLILGIVVPKFVADRETKRADAAEERERQMRDKIDDKILPLLAEVARELAESTEARRRER